MENVSAFRNLMYSKHNSPHSSHKEFLLYFYNNIINGYCLYNLLISPYLKKVWTNAFTTVHKCVSSLHILSREEWKQTFN